MLRGDTAVSRGRQECTYCSVARLKYAFNMEAPSLPLILIEILSEDPSLRRITLQRDQIVDISLGMEPAEQLPPGHQLEWQPWRTLNRIRVGVGRSKDNMSRWGYLNDSYTKCRCGQEQTMAHLLVCPRNPNKATNARKMT